MKALTRIELCEIIARNQAGNYTSNEQFERGVKRLNDNLSDKEIIEMFAKQGDKITRLPGGRFFININLS